MTAREQRLDAVIILTPHALHFEQAAAALEAGLDVLLEKPMVMNAEQAVDADPRSATGPAASSSSRSTAACRRGSGPRPR